MRRARAPAPPAAPAPARRPLAFARLRTAHDSTLRDLVHASWDADEPRAARPALPARAATDVSGAAIQAARLAEAAARDAADASAAARAAAAYARKLAAEREHERERERERPDPHHKPALPRGERWRRGVVRPVPLGKVWSFDVVALWHNAIRLDLADLEEIVAGLLDCRFVTLAELRAMFAWFSMFEAFAVTCLKAEEEVLFPWLEQWGRIDGNLSTASRITTKGTIIRAIRDTAAFAALVGLDKDTTGMVLTNPDRNYYDGLKVGFAEVAPLATSGSSAVLYTTVLQRVADRVATFTASMLDYFHEQEKSLPVIIDSLYDVEDMYAAAIERRMIRALWKCGRKDESTVMLLRAVEDAPFPRAWIHRNLKRLERMSVPLWKRRYALGRGAVTAKFRERKRFWERSAAAIDDVPSDSPSDSGDRHSPLQSSSANLSASMYPVSYGRSFNTSSTLEMRFPSANGT